MKPERLAVQGWDAGGLVALSGHSINEYPAGLRIFTLKNAWWSIAGTPPQFQAIEKECKVGARLMLCHTKVSHLAWFARRIGRYEAIPLTTGVGWT